MSRGRAVTAGCLVTLAVLMQVTVLSRLTLPGGGPALLVLVIAVVAASQGPGAGMLAGFAGGLLADLAPPSDHPLGQSVLVLVVLGELVGMLSRRPAGMARSVALVGLATGLAGLGTASLGVVLGQPLGGVGSLLGSLGAAIACNVALAPALQLAIGGPRQHADAPAWGRSATVGRGEPGRRSRGRFRSSAAAGGLR